MCHYNQDLLKNAPPLLESTQRQLDQLSQLSPLWAQEYGSGLVKQAKYLWPQHTQYAALASYWQQALRVRALDEDKLTHWHEANRNLQKLVARLNKADDKRGQYITISELKSSVFAISQALNQSVPLEEKLRQLKQMPEDKRHPSAELKQIEMHFSQLLHRYLLIKDEFAERK